MEHTPHEKGYFYSLKKYLKNNDITYKMLAQKINLTEIAVKKIFAKQDCSLSRLETICKALSTNPSELLKAFELEEDGIFHMSLEAEEHLAQDLDSYLLYRDLYNGMQIDQMPKTLRLTNNEIFKLLRVLEKLDLISVHENNKVTFNNHHRHQLGIAGGPLGKALKKRFGPVYFEKTTAKIQTPNRTWLLTGQIGEDSSKEFIRELNQLVEKFRKTSRYERLTANRLKEFGLVIAFGDEKVF